MPTEKNALSREIQLLPEKEIKRKETASIKILRRTLIVGGFLLVVEIISLFTFFYVDNLHGRLMQTADNLSSSLNRLEEVSEAEGQLETLESNVKIIGQIRKQSVVSPQLLQLIEESIPVDVSLDRLVVGSEQVNLNGFTNNYLAIFYFMTTLEEREEVANVALSSISREMGDQPAEFSLSLTLAPRGL